MQPAVIDIRTPQGDSFTKSFRLERNGAPVDLSGSVLAAEMRDREDVVTPLMVTLGDEPGELMLSYAEEPLPQHGRYRYDIQETSEAGVVQTWITGWFEIERDVTDALA